MKLETDTPASGAAITVVRDLCLRVDNHCGCARATSAALHERFDVSDTTGFSTAMVLNGCVEAYIEPGWRTRLPPRRPIPNDCPVLTRIPEPAYHEYSIIDDLQDKAAERRYWRHT